MTMMGGRRNTVNIHSETFDENTLTKEHAMAQLIRAIALEEEALSKLINTEADKALAFVGKNLDFPTCPSTSEIIKFNYTVIQLLDTMLMAEWMLMKKLDVLMHMGDTNPVLNNEDIKKIDNFDHRDMFDY